MGHPFVRFVASVPVRAASPLRSASRDEGPDGRARRPVVLREGSQSVDRALCPITADRIKPSDGHMDSVHLTLEARPKSAA